MTPYKCRKLRVQLEELWTEGFIILETLLSDAPLLSIHKQDGNMRLCMDYAKTSDGPGDRQKSEDHYGSY